jgi:hypothetical protein
MEVAGPANNGEVVCGNLIGSTGKNTLILVSLKG